ncbi:hypothetical protein CsSME_00044480 [Camellia sinensis var. sinensis]
MHFSVLLLIASEAIYEYDLFREHWLLLLRFLELNFKAFCGNGAEDSVQSPSLNTYLCHILGQILVDSTNQINLGTKTTKVAKGKGGMRFQKVDIDFKGSIIFDQKCGQLRSAECSTADDLIRHKETSDGALRGDRFARGTTVPISSKFKRMVNEEAASRHREHHRDNRLDLGRPMRDPPPVEIGPKRFKVRGPSILGPQIGAIHTMGDSWGSQGRDVFGLLPGEPSCKPEARV